MLLQAIDPSKINLRITRKASESILATWDNPNKKINNQCYLSNVQFRSLTDEEWKSNIVNQFSYTLLSADWRKGYAFRVRMKYNCLDKPWSAWTPEERWAPHVDTNHSVFIPLLLIPLIAFLLYCLFSEKRIKRVFISRIPDPKNTVNSLLTIDESQLWASFENHRMDCMTVDIEIVHPETEEEKSGDPAGAESTELATQSPSVVLTESDCPPNDSSPPPEHTAYVYL